MSTSPDFILISTYLFDIKLQSFALHFILMMCSYVAVLVSFDSGSLVAMRILNKLIINLDIIGNRVYALA